MIHPKKNKEKAFIQIWLNCIGLFFIVYFFSCKGYIEVSDTSFSVQTAEAIVTRARLDIPSSDGATLAGADGRSYSKYGIGLPLYYVPWVFVGHLLSWSIGINADKLIGFLISFANLPFAILALHLFVRSLRQLGSTEKTTMLLAFALGFGTLFWRYAGYDFSEMMQASLMLLAFYGVLRRQAGSVLLGGIGFAGLILVKLVHLALLPVFLGYLLARPGASWRRRICEVVVFVGPMSVALGFVACSNAVRFGNPLESGYGSESRMFIPSQLWWTVPSLIGSLDKGILVFCPVLILGLIGWRYFWRKHRWEATLCSSLIVVNLLLAGSWHSWVGGWSWGPRLLVPTIPLWLFPAAFWIDNCKNNRRYMGAVFLTGLSIFMQIPGILIKDQQIHHIKQTMLTPEEQRAVFSDTYFACSLLFHKLTNPHMGELYHVSEFGVPGNRKLDLTMYRTFQGLNLWTEHIARYFNRSIIRWLPVIGTVIIGLTTVKIFRLLYRSRSDESFEG